MISTTLLFQNRSYDSSAVKKLLKCKKLGPVFKFWGQNSRKRNYSGCFESESVMISYDQNTIFTRWFLYYSLG